MIIVRESDKGKYERLDLGQNPTIVSLDGTEKTRLNVLMSSSWTDEDRARFGIHVVAEMTVPENQVMTAPPTFKREGGKVVQTATLMPKPLPPEPGPSRYDILMQTIEEMSARLGVLEADKAEREKAGADKTEVKNARD